MTAWRRGSLPRPATCCAQHHLADAATTFSSTPSPRISPSYLGLYDCPRRAAWDGTSASSTIVILHIPLDAYGWRAAVLAKCLPRLMPSTSTHLQAFRAIITPIFATAPTMCLHAQSHRSHVFQCDRLWPIVSIPSASTCEPKLSCNATDSSPAP